MAFFDEPDDEPAGLDPERERFREPAWISPPLDRLPASLPLAAVVHRDEQRAVVVHAVAVYSVGFTFEVLALLHPDAPAPERPMHEVLHGYRSRGQDRLRIGIELAGRRAELNLHHHMGEDGGPPEAALTSRGGGGTDDRAGMTVYAWPLPDAGDATLWFRWDAGGLPETSLVVPGDALRAAAATSEPIWP